MPENIKFVDGSKWHDKSLVEGWHEYRNFDTRVEAEEIAKRKLHSGLYHQALIVKFGDYAYFLYLKE